jgi:hypothetical protein
MLTLARKSTAVNFIMAPTMQAVQAMRNDAKLSETKQNEAKNFAICFVK